MVRSLLVSLGVFLLPRRSPGGTGAAVVVEDDIGQQGRASAGTIAVEPPEVTPPASPCKGNKPHRPASLPAGPKGCGTTGKSTRG